MARLRIDCFSTGFALVLFTSTICCAAPLEMIASSDSSDSSATAASTQQQQNHPCKPIEEGDHLPKSSTKGVWTRFEGPSADVAICLSSFIDNVRLCSSEASASESKNITVNFLNDDHPVDWASGPCEALALFAACFEQKVTLGQLDFSACVEESALNMTVLAERHCGTPSNGSGSETANSTNDSETTAEQSSASVAIWYWPKVRSSRFSRSFSECRNSSLITSNFPLIFPPFSIHQTSFLYFSFTFLLSIFHSCCRFKLLKMLIKNNKIVFSFLNLKPAFFALSDFRYKCLKILYVMSLLLNYFNFY